MYLDQWVKVIWGSTIGATSVLGAYRSRRWLIITFLMGANIAQEAFTGW